MTNISQLLESWIESGNQFDTQSYVNYFDDNAIIDEKAVGTKIKGKPAIAEYFETYFIGYKTQTAITNLTVEDTTHASIEVHFKGEFPQKELDGWFNLTFNDMGDKIIFAETGFIERVIG